MSEIPDDIMKAARTVADSISDRMFCIHGESEVVTIARALLAERKATIERCANIADFERHNRCGSESAFERGACSASVNIAAAIRETAR